jgi:hypothetical protein
MKRNILAVILVIFTFFCAWGQNTTPVDLILLLDTSSSMGSSYEDVNNYISGSFLSEFLRIGDTFHLIAFSESPRLDVARRVSGIGDVETIIGRMLIQYPVESGTNIETAISFAEQYAASLPSRPKKIVLVSTGSSDTNNLVNLARQRLNSMNTTLDYVQVIPGQSLTSLPSSGRSALTETVSSASTPISPGPATSLSLEAVPSSAAQTTFSEPAASSQGTNKEAGQIQDFAPSDTNNASSVVLAPSETGTPSSSAVLAPSETGTPSSSAISHPITEPVRGQTTQETAATALEGQNTLNRSWASSLPIIICIILLLLLLLGLITFFASRKLGSSPNRVITQAASSKPTNREDASQFVNHSKDLAKYATVQSRQRTTPYADRPVKRENGKSVEINPSGPLLLNMFVEDQNTAIGKRNIHSLKSGYSLTIGGGKSDFLIFLVPMPPTIGEIRRNGSQCTFVPKKPKYFPDLGSSELRDCINKTIKIISDKNYELRFRFEMYENPLTELNRVLHSVKVPG